MDSPDEFDENEAPADYSVNVLRVPSAPRSPDQRRPDDAIPSPPPTAFDPAY